MQKVITIVGARPQFVKAATLSRQFAKMGIDEKIVHTGQHFDANMSSVFFYEMEIPKPAYNLDIHGCSHGAMTGRMLAGIEQVLQKEKPDGVLVYGDTNSTLAGALAATKMHIPVVHVEAGLRSFNMKMPEEVNRILTDRISDILFCPTQTAVNNLANEGFESFNTEIVKNGDVMYDAALFYESLANKKSTVLEQINFSDFVLGTIHRQENTDNPDNLNSIISALNTIHRSVPVLVPIHPRTRNILAENNIVPEFKTIDPVGYFDMVMLLKHCKLVMTDSGGVQKEAFFFQKPCITLREQTEWIELVENGFNVLTGSNTSKILDAFNDVSQKNFDFSARLYGNGDAATIAARMIGEYS